MIEDIEGLAGKYRTQSFSRSATPEEKRFSAEMGMNYSVLATALRERRGFEAVA